MKTKLFASLLIFIFVISMSVWGQEKVIITVNSFYVQRIDSTIKEIIINAGDEWNWIKTLYDTTYYFNNCSACGDTNSKEYSIVKEHNWVQWALTDNLILFLHQCNNCGNIWIKKKIIRWDSDNKYRKNWGIIYSNTIDSTIIWR